MKALKVTHISTVHPAFDIRIFHKECRSLAKSGMQVNLVITHNKEETIDNVKIIPLPQFKNRFTRICFKPFFAFSSALKTRADIFHFHDPELVFIGLLLKLCGKKVIYDVHEDVFFDILDKHWIPKNLRIVIAHIFRYCESFAAKFFDAIVTATPHINNNFILLNKKTVNINNYPLMEEILDFKKNKIYKKEKIISYVGIISKARGIFEILQSLEGTDIKLYLAGSTSPKSLLKILETCPGWENVRYFGHTSRAEVYSILSNSQAGICLLCPTQAFIHAIPNKIFEYMAVGLPIIVSNFSCWKSLLQDVENAIFVDPCNPQEIREGIKTLIEDEKKCAAMGEKGLQAVKEKYNWNWEKEKLINLYNQL